MIVENTSNKIVGRMIANDIIGADERAIYSYHVQVMLESVVGHTIILLFAALTGHLVEILLFLLSFGILRESTSGYHCKTSVGCFVLSSLACVSVVVLKTLFLRYILYYQGGVDNCDDYYIPHWCYKPPEYGMVG